VQGLSEKTHVILTTAPPIHEESRCNWLRYVLSLKSPVSHNLGQKRVQRHLSIASMLQFIFVT
jgi:hypothetical protein